MAIQLQFVDNFYKYIAPVLLSNSNNNGSSSSTGDQNYVILFNNIINTSGTIVSSPIDITHQYNATGYGKFNYMSFAFGSGTKQVSGDDYELQTKISSGLTTSFAGQHFVDNENYQAVLEFTITISNTTQNSMAINEIGLYKSALFVGGSSYYQYWFLTARGILDETLNIQAGDTKTLTAQLRMPLTAPSV